MITLSKSIDHARRETTITATDAAGRYLCSETWSGTGSRVAVALAQHVRTSAEQLQRRQNIATAASVSEARQLSSRL
ncbi:hypothetical protein [Hymenobacter metallilatus]|uniref:Uncharacterized protein n=1 Tax=Hymenobacter metallilatus TaxID=2493666 RepID=A0A428JLG9_9BACT|nr:hypothetical protein [Hymenobacter metallilatus]RSK33930.1 hypothetical protein EI290_09500 [Hymenobacter metallilatus]